ncbi:MAG: hypothetical protein K4571_00530 [Deltaproteobacteria bacterium]
MNNLMRCKACGFVTGQGSIKDVCPACGVPARMFEPYTHPVSIKRRRILDLHTHPVLVHFPQAFAMTLFLLSLAAFFVPAAVEEALSSTIKVLSALLPFFLVPAIASGLLDGTLRFRRVTTPLLKQKIILGLVFFVIAVVLAVLALSEQLLMPGIHVIFTVLTLIISVCGGLLGLIGGKLLDAKFPG